MNITKTALITVILVCLAILTGCNEEHARHCNSTNGGPVALVPSETGFWQAHVGSPGSW